MPDNRSATIYDIEYTFRHSRFIHDPGKDIRILRCQLTWFQHNRISCQHSRGCLTGNQEEREVPRQYTGCHSDRFLKYKDSLMRTVAGYDLSFITACPTGHIIDIIGCKVNFHIGQSLRLASFTYNNIRQFFFPFSNSLCYFGQILCTFNGSQSFPCSLRLLRRIDGSPNIIHCSVRHTGYNFFRRRIQHIDPLSGSILDELSIDVHF